MTGQEYINDYRNFAVGLVRRYSASMLYSNPERNHLHALEIAMYKMENELNSRVADIIAATEENPSIHDQQLENGLQEISRSSMRELLKRCLHSEPADEQVLIKEKAS